MSDKIMDPNNEEEYYWDEDLDLDELIEETLGGSNDYSFSEEQIYE